MKVVVTGGTGFVGRGLVPELLKKGHQVVLLTRSGKFKSLPHEFLQVLKWDGKTTVGWASVMDGADAVINLAGEPIAGKRWTRKQKQILRSSRLDAATAIFEAIHHAKNRPIVLINASAVGYYGSLGNEEVIESHPPSSDFLGQLCVEWEKEAMHVESLGVRVVCLRIGVVLEKEGGALGKMVPPFEFFMGGPLGSGKQYFPWVHRDDVVGAILFAMTNKNLQGAVNMTAPHPVPMDVFCKELGNAMHRPSWLPVPTLALRILLGEVSQMLVSGANVIPRKLMASGFRFRHSDLDEALSSILNA